MTQDIHNEAHQRGHNLEWKIASVRERLVILFRNIRIVQALISANSLTEYAGQYRTISMLTEITPAAGCFDFFGNQVIVHFGAQFDSFQVQIGWTYGMLRWVPRTVTP
jgi:hypothetical protein